MATIDLMLRPLMFTFRLDIKVFDMYVAIYSMTKIDLRREESVVTYTYT